MQTKLGAFCERFIEAGWLAALIIVPLFFHVYSSRVFEPDKLTLLRSIAFLAVLGWIIKSIDTKNWKMIPSEAAMDGPGWWQRLPAFLRVPLVLPALVLVLIYIISTITSVVPRVSLWGSYQRLQGTYTTLAYVAIFFLLLATLRRREQYERLVTTIIVVSLPVALYGIIQHYGRDWLPWAGDVTARVASTMGNSIFVAAYLIMAVPLTLSRLVEAIERLLSAERETLAPFLLAISYVFVLAVQVICIFFTQSRGPWLGLFAGLFFFVLLFVLSRGMRKATVATIGIAIVGIVFLVLMNIPNSPLERLRETPYIGRLGTILETEGGTGKVRVLIWQGAVELLQSDPARAIIGYGPESMYVAYNPFYPRDLAHYEARNASPDRSHNETFDSLVITGALGFIIYLTLFTSVFTYGLRWVGLIQSRRQTLIFIALWLLGGFASAIGFWAVDGSWRFFGVALPIGLVVGFFIYLMGYALFAYRPQKRDLWQHTALVALLSAVLAHFVEIHLGISIASTRTYFWVYIALMVLLGTGLVSSETTVEETVPEVVEAASRSRSKRRRSAPSVAASSLQSRRSNSSWGNVQPAVAGGLVIAVILITMVFDFMVKPEAPSLQAIWLFSLTWLIGGIITLAELKRGGGLKASWGTGIAVYAAVTLTILIMYMAIHTSLLTPGGDISTVLVVFYFVIFVVMLVLAYVLARGSLVVARTWRPGFVWAYPVLAIIVVVIVWSTNVNSIRADVFYKQGNAYDNAGQWDNSIQLYERALQLAPDQDFYYLFLGRALLEKAKAAATIQERDGWLKRAEQVLLEARNLNPLNTDHTANLGRLYRTWAELLRAPNEVTQRNDMYQKSLAAYQEATKLSPNNAQLWNEWGLVYQLMGNTDEALAKYQRSLELDTSFSQTYLLLGDANRIKGDAYRTSGDTEKANSNNNQSIDAYKQALKFDANSVQAHSALGFVYSQQGRLTDAIQENLAVLKVAPNDQSSQRNLTLLYAQNNEPGKAAAVAEAAVKLNPNDAAMHLHLAGLYAQLNRSNDAVTQVQSALNLAPKDPGAWHQAATVYQQIGRNSDALKAAQTALQLSPNDQTLQALVSTLSTKQ
ncbi:MAG: tetratricopeptide repeat protein [Chloroflexi bacterium]|nr:tetratricopeptide repeat protein [Chloroflexota bacterium]